MATAKERHEVGMARLMELGQLRLAGKSVRELASHYKISQVRVRQLLAKFHRITTPEGVGKWARYPSENESESLMPLYDSLRYWAGADDAD
jgi:hypothetical protein